MSGEQISKECRELAAIAYGEASPKNVELEMFAIASVMLRQRDARGYNDISTFVTKDKTYSFVVRDGNVRYKKMMKAGAEEIATDAGMSMALKAANNALSGGKDHSNGAYFWDGADIKSNYKKHAKIKLGIKFTDPEHNIYEIEESQSIVIKFKYERHKTKGKVVSTTKTEVDRYENVYDSTAAHGGTIFWKFSRAYVRVTGAREYI